jgi:hypothetical protein
MVFSRKSDAALASLVKQIDEQIAKNSGKKLSSFVNLLGEDREALEGKAKELAAESKPANVAIVVPVEFEDGPKDFGINPKAEVTVMLYNKLKVVSNHAFGPGEFDAKDVEAIVADVPKILE